MADLTIAFDPGSSLSKVFYTLKSFQPRLLLMEPEVAQVPQKSLEAYEQSIVGTSAAEDSAWVEYKGQYRAVGFLARNRFFASLKLEEPKFELAVYKTLAIVGALAQKECLANGASIRLGILFPYGEYTDRGMFVDLITEALAGFRFRGVERSFELESIVCCPEGFGLVMRGRPPNSSLKERTVAVVMIGYRNVSLLVMERGMIAKGMTEDFGFNRLIATIQQLVAGQKVLPLVEAICKAGPKVSTKALAHLVRVKDATLRDQELSRIRAAVATAREEYWTTLHNWLCNHITAKIDEVIFAGGTAHYFHRELNALFPYCEKRWCTQLEEQIHQNFQSVLSQQQLSYRLTDSYGLFFYVCGTSGRVSHVRPN